MKLPNYSTKEERLNYLTHAFGVVLSVGALLLLGYSLARFNDNTVWWGGIIFGLSATAALLCSTIYHGLTHTKAKKIFRFIDHAAIYTLIAGSYTPFALGNLRNGSGKTVFIVVWILAGLGILFKWAIRHHLDRFEKLDAILYLIFGFLAIFYLNEIVTFIPKHGVTLLAIGGLFYVAGVFFYLNKNINYNHAIWHLFVLGGVGAHYIAVLLYAAPPK